jgi:hypothetical protein
MMASSFLCTIFSKREVDSMASSQFQFAIVPGQDQGSYHGMSIGVDGEPRVVLSKPEMRELFQFLMREARNLEDVCCWHGCRNSGTLYRIRGISVRAVRYYCDRHATAVELAGFRVFPVDEA